MQIRAEAAEVLRQLQIAGFDAFLVGGCVRDLLLGRAVHDWDIATSARPEQVAACFEKTVPTGVRFGTTTVLLGAQSFEVTTFRADGIYKDGRRPEAVAFVGTLEQDLARRDFTINAMAMGLDGAVIDLFGGQKDLRDGCIRCVGVAEQRFEEDALRMLRALRFSAQLGFSVVPETMQAIRRCAPLAAQLSAERVRDEVEKTICSPRPAQIASFFDFGFFKRFGASAMGTLPVVPPQREYRWAALLRAAPGLNLEQLRLEKRLIRCCSAAVDACRNGTPDLQALYASNGAACAQIAAALAGQEGRYEALQRDGKLLCLRDLAITGRDLDWLPPAEIGHMLQYLLHYIQQYPGENDRARLLALAHQKKES